MVKIYGTANGFGWKLNDVRGWTGYSHRNRAGLHPMDLLGARATTKPVPIAPGYRVNLLKLQIFRQEHQ